MIVVEKEKQDDDEERNNYHKKKRNIDPTINGSIANDALHYIEGFPQEMLATCRDNANASR